MKKKSFAFAAPDLNQSTFQFDFTDIVDCFSALLKAVPEGSVVGPSLDPADAISGGQNLSCGTCPEPSLLVCSSCLPQTPAPASLDGMQ